MFGHQYQQEKKDFFLDPVPSNVGEEDIKRALNLYNIGTQRIAILERAHDHTRYAFVGVYSIEDWEQLQQLSELVVKEQRIRVRVSKDRSKDDEENQLKAKISVLLRQAGDLGVNIGRILSTPSSTYRYGNELSRTSCRTFHAVKTDCEEVRLTSSLKVDPMTNEVLDTCQVERDPLTEAMYDDVRQADTRLDDILRHYNTPGEVSSCVPQNFVDGVMTPGDITLYGHHVGDVVVEESELGPATSMLKSLHLERSGRNKRGAELSLNNLDHRTVSDDSDSFYTAMSSASHSRAGSQELTPPRTGSQGLTPPRTTLNDLSGLSAPTFPSFNISPGGRITPPPTTHHAPLHATHHQPAPPNLGNSTTETMFTSLVLRPCPARKADLPYNFRYVFPQCGALDDWFERKAEPDQEEEEGLGSPMSVEETFDLNHASYHAPRTFDLNQIEALQPPPFHERERNVNLGRFCMLTEGQDSKDDPQPSSVEPKPRSDHDILKDYLELLQVFRVDIEAMAENKQFDDFEGIALQVNHILFQLKDHRLISQSVIDMESEAILAKLKRTEEDIAEIEKVIGEMDEEEEEDLIEELKEENLPEKEEELKEQKADLLFLQICNVIEHDFAITNASNPE